MPRRSEVPSFTSPTMGTQKYQNFRGVDYSTDETQVDKSRSPRAVNMIADEGGFPEKRWGWRTICQFGATEIVAGIFPIENDGDEQNETFLVHAGTTLYRIKLNAQHELVQDSRETLLTGLVSGGRSQGFYMNGKLFVLTGAEYIMYSEGKAARVGDDNAYVPLTSYQRAPTGGGEASSSEIGTTRVSRTCSSPKGPLPRGVRVSRAMIRDMLPNTR